MAHDPHDHSYKLLFSHPEMVADLLRGYVREPWVEQLDDVADTARAEGPQAQLHRLAQAGPLARADAGCKL